VPVSAPAAAAPTSRAGDERFRIVDGVGVFACALVVRLLYLAQDSSNPFFWHRLIDANNYHTVALLFEQHAWPGSEAMFRPPLYPLLLGCAYRVLGDDIVVAKVMQALVGSLSCVLVYLLGRSAFGRRRIAWLAAGLCAFCGTLVYYDGELLSANLDVFLLLLAVLAAVRAARRGGPLAWALVGAAIGLAAINRGSALLFVPFVLWWIVGRRDEGKTRVARRLLGVAWFLLALAVVIAPVAWHNARFDEFPEIRFAPYLRLAPTAGSTSPRATLRRIVTGRAACLGWADGINAYLGNTPEAQEINRDDRLQHFEWFGKLMAEPWQAGVHTASGHSRYFMEKTAAEFLDHPAARLRLIGHKALQLLNGTEVPRGRRLYAERAHSRLLSLLLWRHGLAFPSGILIPLGLVGLWLARSSWRRHGLVAAALAAQGVFLLVFFVTSRYRAPALPLVALYAAFALVEAGAVIRARRAGVAVVLAGLLIVANLPLDPAEERPSAVEEFDLANALQKQGRLDVAIVHYRAALLAARGVPVRPGLRDKTADVHYNLGTTLHQIGQLDEAIEHYRSALSLDPANQGIQSALDQALADAAAVRARR
jgi:4-amino-4-deoxy-L-arabinose transferase-like glycosyltransferase